MGHRLSKQECEEVRLSYRLDSDELESWVRVFRRYAKRTSSANMDLKGFQRAFADTRESPANLERIFDVFDWDRNGVISFSEFMFAVLINSRVSNKVKMKFAFDMIDRDGNGFIDEDELRDLVFRVSATRSMLLAGDGTEITDKLVQTTFNAMDVNGDGQISLEEFMQQVERHGAWILKLFDMHR